MSFRSADAYDRFIGRYGRPLANALCDAASLPASGSALDVGAGTGALTGVLLDRGFEVTAVDPSEPFMGAVHARYPRVQVRVAAAEALPFPDDGFDVVAAQLVVNFMQDADAGVQEMRRVARPGGVVAAAVWDYAGEMTMLRNFWDAVVALEPHAAQHHEGRRMKYATEASLGELWQRVGLGDVTVHALDVDARYAGFDDLWGPLELGVGPAGTYVGTLDREGRERLRGELRRRLGVGDQPFTLSARAWGVVGIA